MFITLIAALAKNNVIGCDGRLPWHIPADLRHFKQLTLGHIVLMGRKTWESIPEKFRPLPQRTNIVITRQKDYPVPPDVLVYASIDAALTNKNQTPTSRLFVIGGADVYAQTIERADRLEITHVEREVKGNVFFPLIDPAVWKENTRDQRDGFAFVTYTRR